MQVCSVNLILKERRGVALGGTLRKDSAGQEVGGKAAPQREPREQWSTLGMRGTCGWGGAQDLTKEGGRMGLVVKECKPRRRLFTGSLKDNQINWDLGEKIWQISAIISIMLGFAKSESNFLIWHRPLSLVQGAPNCRSQCR